MNRPASPTGHSERAMTVSVDTKPCIGILMDHARTLVSGGNDANEVRARVAKCIADVDHAHRVTQITAGELGNGLFEVANRLR